MEHHDEVEEGIKSQIKHLFNKIPSFSSLIKPLQGKKEDESTGNKPELKDSKTPVMSSGTHDSQQAVTKNLVNPPTSDVSNESVQPTDTTKTQSSTSSAVPTSASELDEDTWSEQLAKECTGLYQTV